MRSLEEIPTCQKQPIRMRTGNEFCVRVNSLLPGAYTSYWLTRATTAAELKRVIGAVAKVAPAYLKMRHCGQEVPDEHLFRSDCQVTLYIDSRMG